MDSLLSAHAPVGVPLESLRVCRRAYPVQPTLFAVPVTVIYPPLQLVVFKSGDVHLVRDAKALPTFHATVLDHFLQTPQHRHAEG